MKQRNIAAALALIWAGASAAQEATPVLGPGDKIRISVLGQEDLSTDYVVRGDGTITMHIVGTIDASGLTPADMEARVEAKIEQSTDLPASVTLEVASWRRVFVDGDVDTPGAQPFVEGLSVGRIVALSGGHYPRPGMSGDFGLDLRMATERGNIATQKETLAQLHARRLRLEAEAAGKDDLHPDAILQAVAGEEAHSLLQDQEQIMATRTASDEVRMDSAQQKAQLAVNEASSLVAQQEVLREKIEDSEKALADVESLLDRGLTSSDRALQLRRVYNNERVELMDAASYEARARQTELDARETIRRLSSDRQFEIAIELAQIAQDVRQAEVLIANSERIIRNFGATASTTDTDLLPPRYRIRRMAADGTETILPADVSSGLLPGDLLEVRRGGWPEDQN